MKKTIKTLILILLTVSVVFSAISITAYAADSFENEIAAFPESYKVKLRELHKIQPKWKFKCVNTGIDWADAVEGENYADSKKVTNTTSAIPSSANSALKDKSTGFYNASTDTYSVVDAGFVRANKIAISYYMDPRNFLNETDIFQFELLAFSDSLKVSDVDAVLSGTVMYNKKIEYYNTEGKLIKTDMTYAQCIYNAGKKNDVNPCFLASKIKNEVVVSGGLSGSASGQKKGYEGYYNFFNVGAYASTTDPQKNALEYAKASGSYGRPWDTPEKSINGGAQFNAEKYIAVGQNTGYLQKFNVAPKNKSSLYTHQYMSNIVGVLDQARSTYKSYSSQDRLSVAHTFSIPVYNNMPGSEKQLGEFSMFDAYGQTAYATETLNIRSEPNINSDNKPITTLSTTTKVNVISKCRNTSTSIYQQYQWPFWCKVSFENNGQNYTGYVVASALKYDYSLNVSKGDTFTLPLSVKSSEQPALYTWDTSVISIDSKSNIKALAKGSATVTAVSSSGGYEEIKINVGSYSVSSLTVSNFAVNFGQNGADFSWKSVSGAYGYEFYITQGNNVIYAKRLSSNKTSVNVSSLNLKSDFTAKIRAYTSSSSYKLNGKFSNLDISNVTINKVTGVVCDNITTDSYRLSWKAVANADGYEILKYNSASGSYDTFKTVNETNYIFKSQTAGASDKYCIRAFANTAYGTVYGDNSDAVEGYTYKSLLKGLSASSVNECDMTVKWQSVSSADRYAVYIFDESKSAYIKKGETDGKTEFKITSLKAGTAYKIRIEALNTSNTGDRLAGGELTVKTKPSKVTGVKMTSSTGYKVKLSWSKVNGAEAYFVYLLNTSTGKYEYYRKATTNSCNISSLSPLSSYSVKVCAVVYNNSVKLCGSQSEKISIYTGPKKPTGLKTSDYSADSVTLKWTKAAGADGYRVYCVDSSGKEKYVATTKNNYFVITSLNPEYSGQYVVKGYRKVGSAKIMGSTSSKKKALTVPAAITGIKATNVTKTGYTISWSKSQNADAYNIYRYNSNSKTYIKIGSTDKLTYKISDLYSAKKDKYKIVGYISSGQKIYEGIYSSAFSVSTAPKNVSGLTATKQNDGSLIVKWQKAPRATGYRVYAYNNVSKKWVSLGYSSSDSYKVSASVFSLEYTKVKVISYVKTGSVRYYATGTETKIK